MPLDNRILDILQQRLNAAVNQSPLLRLKLSAQGRLVDCMRLGGIEENLPADLMAAVLTGKSATDCHFDMNNPVQAGLYQSLDRRIRGQAELARRETGVHALWLGYPLFYANAGEDKEQSVFAPLLLWPVQIETDLQKAGCLRIRPAVDKGPLRLNKILQVWLRRQFRLHLPAPGILDNWTEVSAYLEEVRERFKHCAGSGNWQNLRAVPKSGELNALMHPALFASAILGYWRRPNQALLEDLENLKEAKDFNHALECFFKPVTLPAPPAAPPEEQRYPVYNADFSQTRAIWQGREVPGLLVHGPPGTGKSQTIVNIIADTLARGGNVLMLCQKQAALQVVYERLRAVGLEELCVQVEDSEADRMGVFRALRRQVEQLPPEAERDRTAKTAQERQYLSRQIKELEKELGHCLRALHEPNPALGIAYRDVLARQGALYAEYAGLRPWQALLDALEGLNAAQPETIAGRMEYLGQLFVEGDPLNNPWRHHGHKVRPSPALNADIQRLGAEIEALDQAHQSALKTMPRLIVPAQGRDDFFKQSEELLRFFEALNGTRPLPEASEDEDGGRLRLSLLRSWTRSFNGVGRVVPDYHKQAQERTETLLQQVAEEPDTDAVWDKLCKTLNLASLNSLENAAEKLTHYQHRPWHKFVPGFHRARRVLQKRWDKTLDGEDLWQQAAFALASARKIRRRAQLHYACQTLVPGHPCHRSDITEQKNFVAMSAHTRRKALWLYEEERRMGWPGCWLDAFAQQEGQSALHALLDEIKQGMQRLPMIDELMHSLDKLESFLQAPALEEAREHVRQGRSLQPWLQSVYAGLTGLPALLSLEHEQAQGGEVQNRVLQALLDYETCRRDHPDTPDLPRPPDSADNAEAYGRWWGALTRFNATLVWQRHCERSSPQLLELDSGQYEHKSKRLESLLEQKRALEPQYIRDIWQQRQIPLRSRPWKQLLQMRSSKRNAAKRLREAVRLSLSEGLLDLRPCWLSNPETAAQIFPLRADLFDLVIFDEASQCTLEQALPAIYRGKRLVVCGDEKQLPPTGFFSARIEDLEDDANLSEDQDSADALQREYVLQADDLLSAATGNLPECYLRVHYRSLHPALIEFSNQAFYGGLLEVPPATYTAGKGRLPLRYHAVQGCYEKRGNHIEAQEIIRLLRKLWLGRRHIPSVGVITFNQVQQALIEQYLGKEAQSDPEFAVAYKSQLQRRENNQDTAFFVKNLETVQGDERDVILFSTTFGFDPEGRFYRRFGPLSAAGGERRLNVAITRARAQVVVVGSMPLEQIADALKPGTAQEPEPAGWLQLYLYYAENFSNGRQKEAWYMLRHFNIRPASRSIDQDPLLDELQQVVEGMGYQVERQPGSGGLQLGMAVFHPQTRRCLLGIDCDGGNYKTGDEARFNAVWRKQTLEQRGWRLYQVWSNRWWRGREEESEKLRRVLREIAGEEKAESFNLT